MEPAVRSTILERVYLAITRANMQSESKLCSAISGGVASAAKPAVPHYAYLTTGELVATRCNQADAVTGPVSA